MDPGSASGEVEGEATVDPTFGLPARWIPENRRQEAEMLGYTVVDAVAVLVTHFTETVRGCASELLTRDDVKTLLEGLREQAPTLVEDVTTDLLSVGDIQKVLKGLPWPRMSLSFFSRVGRSIQHVTRSSSSSLRWKEAQPAYRALPSQSLLL